MEIMEVATTFSVGWTKKEVQQFEIRNAKFSLGIGMNQNLIDS